MSALQKLGIDPTQAKTDKIISQSQSQTRDAFSFKWAKRDTYESDAVKKAAREWLFDRYCDNRPKLLSEWLSGERKIILDVGCGSGFTAILFFGDHLRDHDYLGIDVSDAVDTAKIRFKEASLSGDFLKTDLMQLSLPERSVDIIYSEGVFHHTDSTEESLRHCSRFLKKNGRILFYVYRKKAVIREFTDDYIRNKIKDMTDQDAWASLESLTKLGASIGNLNVEIDVPEDVPLLDIKKGKLNLQRFFYWNICKAFYRPEYSMDEMNHINFDWFRPLNCHRHTPEEIRRWSEESGLEIERMKVEEAGITVVAIKRS